MARKEDSMWACILRARYLKGKFFFEHNLEKRASQVWKGIIGVRSLIWKGACYKLRNGCTINPWTDPWILGPPDEVPKVKLGTWISGIHRVRDLKDPTLDE